MVWHDWLRLGALALFLLLAVARSISIRRRRRLNPVVLKPDHDWRRWLLETSFFAAVNVWSVEVVLGALPGRASLFPAPLRTELFSLPPLQLVGALLVIVGLGLDAAGLAALGDSWRLGVDEERPGELVTGGIYRLTRNPIYLFFNLFFLGVFLLQPRPVFLLFWLFAVMNLHGQIRAEERFLARRHGQRYQDYCRRTSRYWTVRGFDN